MESFTHNSVFSFIGFFIVVITFHLAPQFLWKFFSLLVRSGVNVMRGGGHGDAQ